MFSYLSQVQVRRMAQRGVLVLSPHFDDGCFSIGMLLLTMGKGELINVFTRSLYAPGTLSANLTESEVHEIRDAEDQAFAKTVGFCRSVLGGAEPDIRGRRPNDMAGISEDVEAVESGVLEVLERHTSSDRRPYLLVPMACGRHVQHHAVHEVVRRNFSHLVKVFRLGFYEDLPYAHVPITRHQSVGRFKSDFPDFCRYAFSVSWEHKKKLIEMYPSQLRRKPHFLKFRPAALWPLGAHEAIWFLPSDVESGV